MRLLALDSATEACSAALYVDGETRERHEIAPRRHGELLLPMAKALLAEAELELAQLDGLAFGRGPGAFTGVRIATGLAQGLAYGAGLPLVPVSDLAAQARRHARQSGARRVLSVQDARMREIYWAAFDCSDSEAPEALGPERVSAPAALLEEAFDGDWHGVGNGWAAYADVLAPLAERLVSVGAVSHPHAGDIACLAAAALARGEGVAPALAGPSYVRDDVARKPRR